LVGQELQDISTELNLTLRRTDKFSTVKDIMECSISCLESTFTDF